MRAWTPLHKVEEMLKRISRNRFLCPFEDEHIFDKVCKRYSGNAGQTKKSVYEVGFGHYKNGSWNCTDLFGSGTLFKCDEAYEDLVPYTCLFTRKVIEKDLPKSEVVICACCGTHRGRISYRNDLYYFFHDVLSDSAKATDESMLCTKCWNKYKPLAKNVRLYKENKTLINKLNKERLKWLKSKQLAI